MPIAFTVARKLSYCFFISCSIGFFPADLSRMASSITFSLSCRWWTFAFNKSSFDCSSILACSKASDSAAKLDWFLRGATVLYKLLVKAVATLRGGRWEAHIFQVNHTPSQQRPVANIVQIYRGMVMLSIFCHLDLFNGDSFIGARPGTYTASNALDESPLRTP